MPKILLVKTSSLGDVIHELPAVTDILTAFPGAVVDWVVEEGFRELPALHPGVRRVVPVAVRRWRRSLARAATWREMAAFVESLRRERYDLVLDSQGLIKSAAIALLAQGPRCGYDRASAREAPAAYAYHRTIAVPRDLHAVERNRLLAGHALGYLPSDPPDYGIRAPAAVLPWLPHKPYAVLLHGTSRADKEWPEAAWLALAAMVNRQGLCAVLPWGGERERERSERLAQHIGNAVVPPAIGLAKAAALLAGARAAVGVDTGLTHLAAALGVPVLALYCASDPGLTGVYCKGRAASLGRQGQCPSDEQAIAALAALMGGAMNWRRWAYTGLLYALLPYALVHLLWRGWRQREYLRHWGERFGFYPACPPGPLVWLHTVSVGETRAAAPLIRALQARYPDLRVLLTHMTPTGRETARELFGDGVMRCYLPYDYPFAPRRFLAHFRPRLGILLETEIWPNLIRAGKRTGFRSVS